MTGRWIVLEGLDGAGKSSQLPRLTAYLQAALPQTEVLQTREPGGTPLAETLRSLILGEPMPPLTELLLVTAARRDHLENKIWPALQRGAWVVSDRFMDSTLAYQGYGRGLDLGQIDVLAGWVLTGGPAPDLRLVVDLNAEEAEQRRQGRDATDRFESEAIDFARRVRQGYHAAAAQDPHRCLLIDGRPAPDVVWAEIQGHIDALINAAAE